MRTANELFDKVLRSTTDELYVQNPCKVVNVHGNFVDVLLYINDEDEDFVIYNVPIIRPETQRAYIFLGIKEGDRGLCRFFDRSVEGYLQSDFDYNSDERQHDINDRCFELGFIPDKESFIYPENVDIEIGMKDNSAKISFANGNITIIGTNLITQGNMTHTGNLTVNGTLTATTVVAENGASGTFANQVTIQNGITTSGS